MSTAITTALAITVPTIVLALVMLILILWQDGRSESNRLYSGFMLVTVLWFIGTLIARVTAFVSDDLTALTRIGLRFTDVGFTGACLGLCLVVVSLTGGPRRVNVPIMGLGIVYALLLLIFPSDYSIREDRTLLYAFSTTSVFLYLYFIVTTAVLAWQERRKLKDQYLLYGILGFCIGMSIEIVSPELRSQEIGLDVCAIAILTMTYASVRMQIIEPLAGRANQLRAVRDVGLAITSRLRLEEVLSSIAGQAADLLQADAAAIFLNQKGTLELAAVHNMPSAFLGSRLASGQGLAGTVANNRLPQRLENYRRDWKGLPDMPYAKQSFGAVVAVPLVFADEVMGVLVVVESPQGKRFDKGDLEMLELLGPQAAVAITNSRLFERQHALASELEAAKYQLETVLSSTENPVIALNRRFEVIFANPAAESLVGISPLTGHSLRQFARDSMIPKNPLHVLRELHRNRVYVYELTAQTRTYLCHIALLGRPRSQGYVAVLNDVSQLKELDRLQNQMIHMTSHDLKNPLTAAKLNIEGMQEEFDLTDDMRKVVETVWLQLERMERIISGILNLERVKSGTPTYEEFALNSIIDLSVRDLRDQAEKKGVTLTVAIPDNLPVLNAVRHDLTQVINNLLDNAIKFTLDGGQVSITAEYVEDSIVVHVADTGIGIPFDKQSRIFERFYRAYQPGTEHISGTGLGLSLVKAVIDAHKGRIWLESEVNKGTTIHLALPVKQVILPELRR